MKGFVIYPSYEIIENKSYVTLYGRLENGESFLTINEYKPYFYIKEEDLEIVQTIIENLEYEKTKLKNFNNQNVMKIIINLPVDVPKIRKKLEENNIETYEADIKFSYRFMFDKNIMGSLNIEGDYESGERIDRIYKNPQISKTNYIPTNLKILSFDIESGKGEVDDELYCIGLMCGKTTKVFLNTKEKVEGAISCNDEEDVIEKFIQELIILDPDVITGWNIIGFDLDYLNKKCKKLKINFDFGRIPGKCKLKIEENFFRESKADICGRQVLDGMHLLKVSFIKVKDYKLDTVANTILGEGKLIHSTGAEKYKEIDHLWKNNKKKLIEYNIKDAELVLKIIEKTKILDLTIHRSLLTGMPLDRVNASIASLDSLYIREAKKVGIVTPSGNFVEKEEGIKGGYVRESKPGIYDYIIILDFKSLYPSMIRTFNIDPYSFVKNREGKNLIIAPNGACFRNENGILPKILTELYHERELARKNKDELTRHAIKILSNSFFGVLGNPSCRFFDMDLVNSITYFGQKILKLTHQEIEKLGYEVIGGDTDSNFVVSNAKSLEEADKIGKKIEKHINKFYKNLIKKEYKRESFLELTYEKCFIKFVMPKLRGKEEGAKKRYVGMIIKDRKEEIQFTGMEAIRGDWTDLAKKYQNEIYNRIFHNKEIAEYTKKFVEDLKNGKYDELLIYRKSIRKELEGYTKSTPPHVKAARKIKGELESDKIEYIITEDGPEPIKFIKHKLDYKHYIDKQIKPIADSVLVFFNKNFDDLMSGNKQGSLFDY